MKKTFQEYQKISQEELQELWDEKVSHIVFDTNVLLNLYRYSANTSNEFLEVLSALGERLWIPHQVGLEYFRNRADVISDQISKYGSFLEDMKRLAREVENSSRNPFFSKELTSKIFSMEKDIQQEVDQIRTDYESKLNDDKIKEKLLSIFDGRVGQEYSAERKQEIFKEGERRYKDKVPPGFCDDKKPSPQKYGDLIIWNQILDHAAKTAKSVILVLDDSKEDWWLDHKGKTISPHPELLKEFAQKTAKRIHLYRPFQFLEYASQYLQQSIGQKAIEEVKNYVADDLSFNKLSSLELKIEGKKDDFFEFYNFIKLSGYQLYSESKENIHALKIVLPDIPDLERRFHSRYISSLEKYALTLLELKHL